MTRLQGFQVDIADLESGITHDNTIGSGTNTHTQIDTHMADLDIHVSPYLVNSATGAGSPAIAHNVLATEDVILVDATNGDVLVQLHTITTTRQRALNIKRIDNSANVVTVQGTGSPIETIDGANNKIITTQYDNLTIVNSASEWHIL